MQPDFNNLSEVWKTLNPTGVKAADYNPTNKPVACPEYTSGFWEVDPNFALPTLGQVHTFGAERTTASSASTTAAGSGSQTSGSAQAGATSSTGAAPDALARELKGAGAAMAGAVAVLAWL
jgi:1,3-beta-glucanosyltransferase GAS1